MFLNTLCKMSSSTRSDMNSCERGQQTVAWPQKLCACPDGTWHLSLSPNATRSHVDLEASSTDWAVGSAESPVHPLVPWSRSPRFCIGFLWHHACFLSFLHSPCFITLYFIPFSGNCHQGCATWTLKEQPACDRMPWSIHDRYKNT